MDGVVILQAQNLPEPWGVCSDEKQLNYYENYTQSACEVECETKDLFADCQCRDAYMPNTGASK